MAGLLDFLLGQGGGGLLGQMQGQPPPPPQPGGYGTDYVNTGTGGLLGSFRGALNQIANPQALQDAYQQQQNQQAGMALLKALPGGQQPAAAPPLAPGMSPMPSAAPQGNTPRGLRNNNPLNIEAGDFTQNQPGYTGSDGRFAQFASMDHGISAANSLLDTYQNKYGLNTVGGIINRWAPPGENDSRGYAASVAGRMGISPDQPLTPAQRPALIAAMAQFENGRPLPSQSAPAQGAAPQSPQGAMPAGLPMGAGMPSGAPQAPQGMPGPMAQAGPPGAPPGAPAAPQAPPGQNMAGSNLTLLDSPALQGMPDTVRKALPLMLASKQYAPQAIAMIQKYINPEQWQMFRDAQGNVITRNTATGESKPLISATPDMQNAAASGMPSPLAYQTATQFGKVAAENTGLTPEQKNAGASGGMSPLQYDVSKVQEGELAKTWVKKYETATEAGVAAQKQIPQLAAAKNIITSDPGFYSGIGSDYNLALKKLGVAVGLDPNMAASQEVVGKILSDQIVSGLRTSFGGLGQVRVAELNALQNSLASKSNTPAALAALVTMAQKTQQRAADIADIAMNYDSGSGKLNAGYDRAVADYDKTHPFLSQDEISNYKKIAAAPGTAPAAAGPNPAAIAEARRRGLIK